MNFFFTVHYNYRIILLHTGKKNCIKRSENFDENYDFSKQMIVDYFENKNCLIHINGNHSVNTVKTEMWARVRQNQR